MDAPIAANAAENVGGVEAEAPIASRGTKSNAKLLAVFATLNANRMAAGFVAKTDKAAKKGRGPTLQHLHDLLSGRAGDVSSPFHGGRVPNADSSASAPATRRSDKRYHTNGPTPTPTPTSNPATTPTHTVRVTTCLPAW